MRLDYIEQNTYTANFHVQKFIKFLAEIICSHRAINCQYSPKKDKHNVFSITQFRHGLDNYSWAGQSFYDTQATIIELTEQLRKALSINDEISVLQTSLSILEWGQVYRGCIDWLVTHSKNNQLANTIKQASAILDGTVNKSKEDFIQLFDRGGQYRCNSGTTKIFALCSKQSIIYDGRVACAIGMLVHDYLIESSVEFLPAELNFLMDASQRNTSKFTPKKYQFASKADSQNTLINQAISSLKINLILQEMVSSYQADLFGFSSQEEQLRAIEAVLFMIGYEVNESNYQKTGRFLVSG